MRPIGGWALGRYADRFGRRSALTLSVTVMAAGSLMIAVTPGYQPPHSHHPPHGPRPRPPAGARRNARRIGQERMISSGVRVRSAGR
ncbi:hypothetical protein, partial [Nocardia abscessus]|uniref:hypothetical protein n=1 Tax=Nocardia abscessus TaxID=120957 RepID=UPI002458F4E4